MTLLKDRPIAQAKNIGPTIAKRLNKIGIQSLADLSEMTPAKAYQKLSERQSGKHLPLCYYLYSLQGALLDVHWEKLTEDMKLVLREEARR
ncbi:MAG: TfoX/Sxy family DNA transformation protein [Saprospiraceae bacterium]